MNVLQNSYKSQRDTPTRLQSHSLCQDLQQLGAKTQIQQFTLSKNQIQIQIESPDNQNCFFQPNLNNKLEYQPHIQLENHFGEIRFREFQDKQSSNGDEIGKDDLNDASINKDQEDNEKEKEKDNEDKNKEEGQDNDSNSSPRTITLIQQNIEREQFSLNLSSKLSQYTMQVDNQSYATFLSIRDTSYNSLIKNFQLLFENITNLFVQRIKIISQTYLTFIKVKYNQQKSYFNTKFSHINNRNHIIYINCKTILQQIRNKINQQLQKRTQYIKILQQLSNRLEKHLNYILSTIQAKKQKIIQIHTQINQIVEDMSNLMIPQMRKKCKNTIDKEIYKSNFLRTKYLMSKQNKYLALIASYLQKVLNYISVICLDIEPKTNIVVKQIMLKYVQAYSTLNPENKNILEEQITALQKTNCLNQTYEQVTKMLQLCIPNSICPQKIDQTNQNIQKKLKNIIQSLISQSQSLVYIPVIQLQPKDYAYHSKNKANVRWLKLSASTKKLSKQSIQQHQTHLIITYQGQLILQLIDQNKKSEQKMAVLKLKNIKFSRKNNLIYLTDRGTGMLGYLLSSNQLIGTLCFQSIIKDQNPGMEVDQFIERVKDVLELQKINKDKNRNINK